MSEIVIFDRASLENAIWEAGVSPTGIHFVDQQYVLPKIEWCLAAFRPYFAKVRDRFIGLYRAESRDCDDFSELAWATARVCHWSTPGSPEAALAFGCVEYTKDSGQKHWVNFIVCMQPDTEVKHVFWFEPQTGKLDTHMLSITELNSINWGLI